RRRVMNTKRWRWTWAFGLACGVLAAKTAIGQQTGDGKASSPSRPQMLPAPQPVAMAPDRTAGVSVTTQNGTTGRSESQPGIGTFEASPVTGPVTNGCPGGDSNGGSIPTSRWQRCKAKLQWLFLGYPSEFREPPLGYSVYVNGRTMVANG